MGFLINSSASGSSGGGSGDTPTGATLTFAGGETTSDFNISAGAYKVRIKNAGFAGGGAEATADVNGVSLFPGDELILEAVLDPVANEWKTLPAFSVTTNGAEIWYYVLS